MSNPNAPAPTIFGSTRTHPDQRVSREVPRLAADLAALDRTRRHELTRRRSRHSVRRLALVLLVPLLAPARPAAADGLFPAATAESPAATEAVALAVEAHVYAYPLVLMELTRRVQTNAGEGAPPTAIGAPMNQFAHQRTLPDAMTLTAGQRPNADVLTSSLWFDVGPEPLVLTIPDAEGRYYTLPMFDLWTDVFAALGPRTSGGGAQTVALTARGWSGMLPDGVARLETPTETGRLVARIRTDGPADYPAVHRFQDGLRAVPLSQWGKDWTPPRGTFDPARPMQPPADQILRLSTSDFFAIFTTRTVKNPPHAHDHPILQRIARIGLAPGRPFAQDQLAPDVRGAIQSTPTWSGQSLFESFKRAGSRVNGWRLLLSPMGTYGTDYRRRQVVAFSAFGADLSEDVLYLTTIAAADGKPLESSQRYTLHFDATQLPPAHAFWSLTVYDDRQLLTPNKRKRFTIGDRDPLRKNADGSLDLLLQSAHPGPEREANWLPTPVEGRFTLMLRLYWPKAAALDVTWVPPGVTRVGD